MATEGWTLSSKIITKEAIKCGLAVKILNKDKNLYVVYKDNKPFFFKASAIMQNNMVGTRIADNKDLVFQLLDEFVANCPKPKSIYFKKRCDIKTEFKKNKLNFPLVIKPFDGAHGDNVIVNIPNKQLLEKNINKLFENRNIESIIIQEMIKGEDYRILTVGYKVRAVTKRLPAFVIGDGKRNIKKLIKLENNNPNRSEKNHNKPLSKIIIDDETHRLLQEKSIDINYIPKKKERIFVKRTANLSSGGVGIDCTDKIHPATIKIAEKISRLLKMNLLGVDIITSDISKPLSKVGGGLIEINSCPGLRMHHYPYKGTSKNIAKEILNLL